MVLEQLQKPRVKVFNAGSIQDRGLIQLVFYFQIEILELRLTYLSRTELRRDDDGILLL